jgi:hypothetical protein
MVTPQEPGDICICLPVERTLPWLVTAVLADLPAVDETDAELVRLAQQDLRKFSDLYDRYVQRVYRYLLIRMGSVADAEDVTSQTFMAALENLHRYPGKYTSYPEKATPPLPKVLPR